MITREALVLQLLSMLIQGLRQPPAPTVKTMLQDRVGPLSLVVEIECTDMMVVMFRLTIGIDGFIGALRYSRHIAVELLQSARGKRVVERELALQWANAFFEGYEKRAM